MNVVVWGLAVVASGSALGGCGFPKPPDIVDNDAAIDAPEIDARPLDAPAADAPFTPRCNPIASFGRPIALDSLNTDAEEADPHLSPDELTIYFSSDRPGSAGFDIFQATRGSIAMPFGNVAPVTTVNTAGVDRQPNVTADGLSMFAFNQATGTSFEHITIATRPSTGVAFGAAQVLPTVNGPTNDSDPYILPGGNALYLASDRAGNYGLYRSARIGGAFAAPTIVGGVDLDTAEMEGAPVVSPDELTLYFASTGRGGVGSFDIYEATRASIADGFGAAIPLTSLNTVEFEAPGWISADGCNLYLTRFAGAARHQLFVATRGQ
jgi:Tol biopolymer transport system component